MEALLSDPIVKFAGALIGGLLFVAMMFRTWRSEDAAAKKLKETNEASVPAMIAALAATGTRMPALSDASIVDAENNLYLALEHNTAAVGSLATEMRLVRESGERDRQGINDKLREQTELLRAIRDRLVIDSEVAARSGPRR